MSILAVTLLSHRGILILEEAVRDHTKVPLHTQDPEAQTEVLIIIWKADGWKSFQQIEDPRHKATVAMAYISHHSYNLFPHTLNKNTSEIKKNNNKMWYKLEKSNGAIAVNAFKLSSSNMYIPYVLCTYEGSTYWHTYNSRYISLWGLLVWHVFLEIIISIKVGNVWSIYKYYWGKLNWQMKEN